MIRRTLLIPVVILKTKNGYNGFSPLVIGCAVTDRSIDKTLKRLRGALKFHLESEVKTYARTKAKVEKQLKMSLKKYGSEALYTSLKVAS